MITIKPYGGICNRIRGIDSVIAFTKNDKYPVKLIWELSPNLNCPFDKLFSLPDYIKIVYTKRITPPFLYEFIYLFKKIVGYAGIHFPFGFEKYISEDQLKLLKDNKYNFEELKKYKSVYIETQHRFYSIGEDFYEFKPVQKVCDRVAVIADKFSENTIGVHIRRSDNGFSITNSPLELFINLMNKEIIENPDTFFFLATDSLEDEMKLIGIYGNRIIIQRNKLLDRNDPEAIQDALVDLLCLSRTKKILGSYFSSFSETAALIGRIPIIIVKN